MNRFDKLKAKCFTIVTGHMGYVGAWLSSVDNVTYTASQGVNFKTPTLKEVQLLESQEFYWTPEATVVEYLTPDFPGLYERVLNEGVDEIITIIKDNVPTSWRVLQVVRVYDGDTYLAKVTKISTE